MIKRIILLIKNGPEARTQVLIVMGFIILPIISLSIAFYLVVLDDKAQDKTSQRLKIPQEVFSKQP